MAGVGLDLGGDDRRACSAISTERSGPTVGVQHDVGVAGVRRHHGALRHGAGPDAAALDPPDRHRGSCSTAERGASNRFVGDTPFSSAVAITMGLNADPVWRPGAGGQVRLPVGVGAEVVVAADHRPHEAGARVDRHQRGVGRCGGRCPARGGPRGSTPRPWPAGRGRSSCRCAARRAAAPRGAPRCVSPRASERVQQPVLDLVDEVRRGVALLRRVGRLRGEGERCRRRQRPPAAAVISCCSRIRRSTRLRRCTAASGSVRGSCREGAWMTPAIMADCSRVRVVRPARRSTPGRRRPRRRRRCPGRSCSGRAPG